MGSISTETDVQKWERGPKKKKRGVLERVRESRKKSRETEHTE